MKKPLMEGPLDVAMVDANVVNKKTTIKGEYDLWWNLIKPDVFEEVQRVEMMKAFYAGAATMGFIMTVLAQREGKQAYEAGKIVDRLHKEIEQFFEDEIKKLRKGLKT